MQGLAMMCYGVGGGRAITRAGLTNKQTKHMLRAPGLRGHQAVRSQKGGTRKGKINAKKSELNWKLTENTGKVQITEENFRICTYSKTYTMLAYT